MEVEKEDISRTERFAIYDGKRVVSRAYVRLPYGLGDKPIFIFRVKTNKSHYRQGFCRKVIEKVIQSYGMYDMELRVCSQDPEAMSTKQLFKFYKEFGFRRKRNKDGTLYGTMRRNGDISK